MNNKLAMFVAKREVTRAAERFTAAKAVLVESDCPVKVGDIVEINGFSHRGKSILVDRVNVRNNWKTIFAFIASGKVIKKSGEPGSQRGEWTQEIDTGGFFE